MMRLVTLLAFVVLAVQANAQCCCSEHVVELRTPLPAHANGSWNYSVTGEGDRTTWHTDSVPDNTHMIRLRMDTGCGIGKFTYEVMAVSTGEGMTMNFERIPGDSRLPVFHLDFTQGTFWFDMPSILSCVSHYGGRWNTLSTDTIPCLGSRAIYTYDLERNDVFAPLDLLPYRFALVRDYSGPAGPATFVGGEDGFQRYLSGSFNKALIEQLGVRVTLTGTATVETNGTIHEVYVQPTGYDALEREFARVVQASPRWRPAMTERPSIEWRPKNFSAMAMPVPIRFIVDPKTIWTAIPARTLSLSPAQPTTRDSIHITFHWVGGSGGRYAAKAQLVPPAAGDTITTIAVDFIDWQGELNADIKPLQFGLSLPPLPRGNYRIRMNTPGADFLPTLGLGHWDVRDFEVR